MRHKRLYKYYSFDNNKNWMFPLNVYGLYFDAYENFNDPYECYFDVTTDGEFCKKKEIVRRWNSSTEYQQQVDNCKSEADLKPFLENLNGGYAFHNMRKSLEGIKVTCFSTSPNILLMWSHYTRSHGGFCLEFDVEKMGKMNWVEVQYVEERPKMSVFEKYDATWFFQHKFSAWKYEQEVRAISTSQRHYLPREAITGLYLGMKSLKPENQQNLISLKGLIDGYCPQLKDAMKVAVPDKSKFEVKMKDYFYLSLAAACGVV